MYLYLSPERRKKKAMITARTVTYSIVPTLSDLRNVLRVSGSNTTVDNIITRILRQSQSTLERELGYVVGTGTFTWKRYVQSDVVYTIPRSPVDSISSVMLDDVAITGDDYTTHEEHIFGVRKIYFTNSGNAEVTFSTATSMMLPGEVSDAIEAYVYDRYTNEPPYEFSIRKSLKGTPLYRWSV